jgi:WD40 repeat protein
MSTPSVNEMVSALEGQGLLTPAQLAELHRLLEQPQYASVNALARALLERGWLTVNQINTVNRGLVAARRTDRPSAVPVTTGGYQLLSRIAGGGFGEVWKARAPGGFLSAVKITHRTLDHDEARRELESLEAIKALRHPYLLGLHASWLDGGRLHVAMELADKTLRDRLKECRARGSAGIPPGELLRCVTEAAEALDFLHANKVVHLDVKPPNLLLVAGHVKVGDFGLARAQDVVGVSLSGVSGGTVPYMAPEVFAEHRSGPRADLYSLAVSYAELRLGQLPITAPGSGFLDWMQAHRDAEPALDGMGAAERAVVLKAMAKERARRHCSCGEFADELAAALAKDAQDAVRPTTPEAGGKRRPAVRRKMALLVSGAVALLALVAGVVAFLGRGSAKERQKQLDNPPPVVAADDPKPPPGGDPTVFNPPPGGGEPPAVPPALRPVNGGGAYLANGKPLEWPPPEAVAVLGDGAGRQWEEVAAVARSPRGDLIASGGRGGWYLWDGATLRPRAFVRDNNGPVKALAFAPDGRRLVVGALHVPSPGQESEAFAVYEVAEGTPKRIPIRWGSERPNTGGGTRLKFLADGKQLLGLDEGNRAWRIDLSRPEPTGERVKLAGRAEPGAIAAQSADGSVTAWVEGTEGQAVKVRKVGAGQELRGPPLANVSSLALSADGAVAAVVFGDSQRDRFSRAGSQVLVWSLRGDKPEQTHKRAFEKLGAGEAALSADGGALAFATSDNGVWAWNLREPGTEPVEVGRHGATITGLVLSADGRWVVTGSDDCSVRAWPIDFAAWKQRPPEITLPTAGGFGSVSFAPREPLLVTTRRLAPAIPPPGEVSALTAWEWRTGKQRFSHSLEGRFGGAVFTPDSKSVLTWGVERGRPPALEMGHGFVKLCDAATGTDGQRLDIDRPGVEAVALDAAGKTLAVRGMVGPVTLCGLDPLQNRNTIGTLLGFGSLALSPDGRTLAVPGQANEAGVGSMDVIELWDVSDPEKAPARRTTIPVARIPGRRVRQFAYLPGGKTMVTVDDGGWVKVFDVPERKELCRSAPYKAGEEWGPAAALAVSPDGQAVAVAYHDRLVLRETVALKDLKVWELPGPVHGLAFDPSGRYLATANANGTAYVLDVGKLVPPHAK